MTAQSLSDYTFALLGESPFGTSLGFAWVLSSLGDRPETDALSC